MEATCRNDAIFEMRRHPASGLRVRLHMKRGRRNASLVASFLQVVHELELNPLGG
jgi:hypothetical protein